MIIPHHLAQKRFYVVGLGKTGLSLIRALLKAKATITAWDDNPQNRDEASKLGIPLKQAEHLNWLECDALFLSPGIPHQLPAPHASALYARKHGVPIMCDVELLFQSLPKGEFIGITGSNGKSTTTALITHILKQSGINAYAGGNIGMPVLDLPLEKNAVYILELSSYQLERIETPALSVSVFLNLTPNHLDRHGDMEGYLKAKLNIFRLTHKKGRKILGIDSPSLKKIYEKNPTAFTPISMEHAIKGIYVEEGCLINYLGNKPFKVMDLEKITSLKGAHNHQNIAAAYAAIKSLLPDFSDKNFERSVESYKNLPHRQEKVGKINNVLFINDSKATTLDAAILSIKAYHNIYWILGGQAKKGWEDISLLKPYKSHICKAYIIGDSQDDYYGVLHPLLDVEKCGTLENAFQKALHDAKSDPKETIVLLAPACASWDQFKSFEHRGDVFRMLVQSQEKSN